MLDNRTRMQAAMSAARSASSNEVSYPGGLPTPLAKNISLGTNPTTLWLLVVGKPKCIKRFTRFKGVNRFAGFARLAVFGWFVGFADGPVEPDILSTRNY